MSISSLRMMDTTRSVVRLTIEVRRHDSRAYAIQTGQYIPSAHSTSGPVLVSLPGSPVPLDSRVIATTKEFPDEFPFQEDANAGNTIGVGTLSTFLILSLHPLMHQCQ